MPPSPLLSPLLVLAVILVVGVTLGSAARRLRLPRVTGQILGGLLLGEVGLGVFDHHDVQGLTPITHFALGLMAVTVGAHLDVRRMRNAARRILLLAVAESAFTPLAVVGLLLAFTDLRLSTALVLGAIAVSTAPATIVALVKETRSRGVFVKTLVAAVAMNNVACILLFELAHTALAIDLGLEDAGTVLFVVEPLKQLVSAFAVGALGALMMSSIHRLTLLREKVTTAAVITILTTVGVSSHLGTSPLLACLMLGFLQSNFSRDRGQVADAFFRDFEPAILAIFFTLAGVELTLEHAAVALTVCALFLVGRTGGKILAADVAMRLAGATDKVRRHLGPALVPQAGLAVGLVLLLRDDEALRGHAELQELFVAVVLTAVVFNEIVGPILTRNGLVKSGDAGKDRTRLIDFLHEEHIVTDFEASSMEDAIERMTDVLVTSHRLAPELRAPLLESALERERQATTCFGNGLAVPHGILPAGERMLGVMGLSSRGLSLPTPDGRPVHCIVLLATPENERGRHLQVLATLARTVGKNDQVQEALFHAKTPAHAYEVLHDESAEDFNYFMD